MNYTYSSLLDFIKPSPTAELLSLSADRSLISFGGGFPDSDMFPIDALADAFAHVIREKPGLALQYAVAEGIPSLREKVAQRSKTAGFDCAPEEVLITQGGSQALDLVADLFLDRGDTVICENPTYMGALGPFDLRDCKYVGIDMDENGMDVDRLEAALKAHPEAKLIYVIPDFQNPTGVSLTLERRRRIVELANQYNLLVLEDCPYRELRFEGELLPTLRSFDTEGRVIHLGSFSKILCPGVRLGWVAADREIIAKMSQVRNIRDLQSSTLVMYAVDALLERFDIDSHIEKMRRVYGDKKNYMMELMAEHFPAEVTSTNPQGGMFLWVTFPQPIDVGVLMREVLVPKAKVILLPGESLYCQNPQRNTARVNYSNPPREKIEEGIVSMGKVLHQVLRR